VNINPLLASPSPRNIPDVLTAFNVCNYYDHYYVKHQEPEASAYKKIRNFFLEHTEYTHLILWSDDLVAWPDDIFRIVNRAEEFNFDVIAGLCNVDRTDYYHYFACSFKPHHINRDKRDLSFIHKSQIYDIKPGATHAFDEWLLLPQYQKDPFVRVNWLGFSMPCIKRQIIEAIEFHDDGYYMINEITKQAAKVDGLGCCMDTAFSWECIQNEIPLMIDVRIVMDHLKNRDNYYDHWGIGKYKPVEYLVKAGEKIPEPELINNNNNNNNNK
jgi:hypothetical protein